MTLTEFLNKRYSFEVGSCTTSYNGEEVKEFNTKQLTRFIIHYFCDGDFYGNDYDSRLEYKKYITKIVHYFYENFDDLMTYIIIKNNKVCLNESVYEKEFLTIDKYHKLFLSNDLYNTWKNSKKRLGYFE